jgi:hypothetical protein
MGKEEAKPRKAVRGNGLERLRRAAGRRLAQCSEELADMLLGKALKGKLEGARMLVGLAEKITPRKKKEAQCPSIFDLLANEPEEPEDQYEWNGKTMVRKRREETEDGSDEALKAA